MRDISNELFSKLILDACARIGVGLQEDQLTKLREYWRLFIKWNASYNLSAVRDPEQILYKHIVDSLAVVPAFAKAHFERVLDVGTGGRFARNSTGYLFPGSAFHFNRFGWEKSEIFIPGQASTGTQ